MDQLSQLREAMKEAASVAAESAKGAVGRAKEMVGMAANEEPAVPEEPSFVDELSQSCTLTYKQRLYGFSACLSLGLFCSVLSMLVFFSPMKFAITYSFGNLLALGSTGFLIGFWRQLQSMFDPVRAAAAIVFVVSLFLTLFSALIARDALLTLLCIFIQEASLVWYSLSYIPFAQAAAKRMFRSCYESEF